MCAIYFLFVANAIGQTFPIKERYDYEKGIYAAYSNYDDVNNPEQQFNSTEGLGYVLESLIEAYKTTKDKAYLIKFINYVINPVNSSEL